MKPLQEVIDHTLANIERMPELSTTLGEASGLFLAHPIVVENPVPPFDNTAVDGFAVCMETFAAGIAEDLNVVATVAAGDDPSHLRLRSGEAIRIMTGAPLPPGTDAVVMIEDTLLQGEKVKVLRLPTLGANIRRRGSDVDAGEHIFETGTRITPAVKGVLASLSVTHVAVFRRPIVGVISTGDELSDDPILAPGKIRDSNRPSLYDAVAAAGATAVDLGSVGDDPDQLRAAFTHAVASCDALVTSGGVSVGDFDYTKAVLDELSDNQFTWFQVAIKPAKPYAFGRIAGVPVFGLPGNPVSALVSFELFVRPSIRKMLGTPRLFRPTMRATLTVAINHQPDGKLHLLRGVVETDGHGGLIVTPQGHQGSHVLTGMAQANGLMLVPDGAHLKPGDATDVIIVEELGNPTLTLPHTKTDG
ncbi:MAG: molybdopterin molybdotransferase MoeA [Actinobacteria bacterium]|nr:molybdopterin molybdotransferase MoeA [Actinomycetota bacterium]